MVEKLLHWFNQIYGFNFVALRYFNASGASLDASIGERHAPETHIIPSVIKAVMEKKSFKLFGDTYDTPVDHVFVIIFMFWICARHMSWH